MLIQSRPEMLLLLGLIVASAALAWRHFQRTFTTILSSRKDPDFQLRPLAPRLRELILDVLLQRKVIRQRPLAGLAHASVFWGFCAFALVTINHLAAGFGVELIARNGAIGRIYFPMVSVFVLAVAVGITGLTVRRFLVQPRWLGGVSAGSGVVALLIFILMVSYLATSLEIGRSHV